MVRYIGRAAETVTIPTKPTPEGFKIWVLANQGYILDWLFHAKGDGDDKGPVDLDGFWLEEGFSKTQSVVLDLVHQLPKAGRAGSYVIWFDNLFTSAKLLAYLRDRDFGAAGTVRVTKTKRELIEQGIPASQADGLVEEQQVSTLSTTTYR